MGINGWIDWVQEWHPFGYFVDFPVPAGWRLVFSGEGEDGLPVWERLERVGGSGEGIVSMGGWEPF